VGAPATTTWAAIEAAVDFRRARRRQRIARVWRQLRGRRPRQSRPRDLANVAALFQRPARLQSIPLDAVVGTVDATTDFDADFRPTTDRVADRWQGIALAHRNGRPLPPVTVIERPDGFYVLDGRHRVSVARALGGDAIDAWSSPAPSPPTAAAASSLPSGPGDYRVADSGGTRH
jgi:hypothetical protein